MITQIGKVGWFVLSVIVAVCLAPASVRAQALQFNRSFAASQGVWDVTGNYPNEELDVTNNIDLVQDDKGKITGSGTGSGTEDGITVDLLYNFIGAIKTVGTITRVTWTMKITGSATDGNITVPVTGSIKMTMEVDKVDNVLIGSGAGKICIPRQCERVDGPVQFDLPQPMDGGWNLVMDIQWPENRIVGTGEATLSNGRVIPFAATGRRTDRGMQFKLTGTGGALAFGPPASTHDLRAFVLAKAKLLGQNIPINP